MTVSWLVDPEKRKRERGVLLGVAWKEVVLMSVDAIPGRWGWMALVQPEDSNDLREIDAVCNQMRVEG